MTEASDLAAAAANPDPRVGLRAAVALRRLADALEVLQVDNARLQGWSWQEIAEALDVSRQAVHKKHAGRVPTPPAAEASRPSAATQAEPPNVAASKHEASASDANDK